MLRLDGLKAHRPKQGRLLQQDAATGVISEARAESPFLASPQPHHFRLDLQMVLQRHLSITNTTRSSQMIPNRCHTDSGFLSRTTADFKRCRNVGFNNHATGTSPPPNRQHHRADLSLLRLEFCHRLHHSTAPVSWSALLLGLLLRMLSMFPLSFSLFASWAGHVFSQDWILD